MAIFKIHGKKLDQLKTESFGTEFKLQELVDENLKEIFGLEFIRRELGGQGFSIDTIAYDPESKAPVLIEYKKDVQDSVIDQGMAYLSWLLNHKGDFLIELTEKLGKKDVDWSQARVIFVARNFNPHQINALGFKGIPFELWKYDWSGDIFQIQQIETPKSDVSITSILKTKPAKEIAKEIKKYSTEDYFKNKPAEMVELFNKFRSKINELGDNVSENPQKYYIAYRNPRLNFVSFNIFRDKLRISILLDDSKLDDPKKIVKNYPSTYGYAKNCKYFDFKIGDNFNYTMGIIEQSYNFNNGRVGW